MTPLSSSWENARDELPNRAEPRRQLGLRESELNTGARRDGPGDSRAQVAGEPLGHRTNSEVADDTREVTEPAGHRLQHGQRHRRPPVTEAEHLGPRDEEHARKLRGDRRGNVAEERPLAERGARSLGVKDLLAPPQGDLPDLDTTFHDDEEAPAGLSFFKESIPGAQLPRRTP